MKKILILCMLMASWVVLAYGMYQATQSKAFMIKKVEVNVLNRSILVPITDADIIRMASVPMGSINLFALDLKAIEERLLKNEWIQEIRLEKKPAHTLSIYVTYRHPMALIQKPRGDLSYVDQEGKIFGTSSLNGVADLPLLSGFEINSAEKIKQAIELVKQWEVSKLGQLSLISTVHWDSDRGFRLLVSYSGKENQSISSAELDSRIRAFVDIGHEIDVGLDSKLLRLADVIRYLSGNTIAVRQIWADVGKKIVVKTAHGT